MGELGSLFQPLGLSLLIGLLVGLQREKAGPDFAGMRTFALVAVFGTVCGLLAGEFGGWVLAAGFLGMVAVILVGNIPKLRLQDHEMDIGTTTEVAVLVMFAVGAYLAYGRWEVGIAIGGALAALLQFKPELHGVAERLGGEDVRAIMQFVLITFIVLPVLPDRAFGPLEAFNPFEVWLMVTLIVGISLAGYLTYRFMGKDAGILVGGLLGGGISSTATTLAYARRARDQASGIAAAALVIALASAVVFVRVLIEVGAVAPGLLAVATGPVLACLALSLVPAALLWLRERGRRSEMPEQKNPTELGAALTMAVLYAVIVFGLAAAKEYLGEPALYLVAVVSGLTDVDAITLSVARLAGAGRVDADAAWRLILTAVLSNLVFKAGIAGVLGGRRLLCYVAVLFAAPLAGGAALILAWPAP